MIVRIFIGLILFFSLHNASSASDAKYWMFINQETSFKFILDKDEKEARVDDEVFPVELCNDSSKLNCFSIKYFNFFVAFPKDFSSSSERSWFYFGQAYCVSSSNYDMKTSDLIYVIYSNKGDRCESKLTEQMMIVSQKRGLLYVQSIKKKEIHTFVSIDLKGFGALSD